MRWFQKSVHIFVHHNAEWEFRKEVRPERVTTWILKQELTRMLTPGRSTKVILETFGIAEKRYAISASI